MPTHTVTRNENITNFDTSLKSLEHLSTSIEEGHTFIARQLATTIRSLVHDTSHSTSLLTQLGVKNKYYWALTLKQNPSSPVYPTANLFGLIVPKVDQASKLVKMKPILDQATNLQKYEWTTFDIWWNSPVISLDNKTYSRKNFVTFVANKLGGAHFDKELDEFLHTLSTNDYYDAEVNYSDGSKDYFSTDEVLSALMLQIAFELIRTMKYLRKTYLS
ncbi:MULTISPECIES: hypothetical protein [Enterococcus]|uniref:hypothetical protein n=1 Tax=Enterococcus TaxID=1350 RepID=UPI000EE4F194|nr:hypothetical protein [Enterococcus casseliflavus]HCO72075.1 hypothetical protein [Enterococcus sp.]